MKVSLLLTVLLEGPSLALETQLVLREVPSVRKGSTRMISEKVRDSFDGIVGKLILL